MFYGKYKFNETLLYNETLHVRCANLNLTGGYALRYSCLLVEKATFFNKSIQSEHLNTFFK